MSRDGSRPIRMSPCGAPIDSMTAKQCLRGDNRGLNCSRPIRTVDTLEPLRPLAAILPQNSDLWAIIGDYTVAPTGGETALDQSDAYP